VTLKDQLLALGVSRGDVLLVHTAFSAIRPVEGGPHAVIDALMEAVGRDGTIVMPSWTDDDDEVFDPMTYEVDEHLGIVADTFWQRPDVIRGTHPFAVAAWGRHAEHIAGAPFVLPPHAPGSGVDLVHDLDGKVLLLGVDHDANTTVHLAELLAGVPYRVPHHITVLEDGIPRRIDYGENDHCCQGFNQLNDWLRARGLQRVGHFGGGSAKLMRSRDVTATVIDELSGNRCRLLHPRGACRDCDEAWASVKV
jgi:aminoglycoside N3'-acetyltransferase